MKPKKIEQLDTGLQYKIPVIKEKKLRVPDQNNRKIDAEIKFRNIRFLNKKHLR